MSPGGSTAATGGAGGLFRGLMHRSRRGIERLNAFTETMTRTMLPSGGSWLIGLALAVASAAEPVAATQPAVDETAIDATDADAAVDDTAVSEAVADATAVDALRCWRRVDRNAVFVGERFTMTVTCRTVETEAARTRLDEAALEPATIDATPFEVLSGERFDDVLTGPYRFSQHDYTLRLIAETGFGEDVEIPALELPYRIERRVDDGPALAGRELTYILPAAPVRLLSLVPDAVDDIRDLPPAGFAAVQAGELRANVLGLLSALFGIAALGLVALGALRVLRDRKGVAEVTEKRLSPALAARRALEELVRVRGTAAGNGWTRDAAGRALTALRIASAVALGRPVTQSAMAAGEAPRDGQLQVRHGLLGRRTVALSSSVTAADWRAPHGDDGTAPLPGDTGRLAGPTVQGAAAAGRLVGESTETDLQRAMTLLTAFRYARGDGTADTDAEPDSLARALDAGIGHVARLRWRALAPVRHFDRWADAVRRTWPSLARPPVAPRPESAAEPSTRPPDEA